MAPKINQKHEMTFKRNWGNSYETYREEQEESNILKELSWQQRDAISDNLHKPLKNLYEN